MSPESDGDEIRTVGASLEKLIRSDVHLSRIREVVSNTHKATLLVTELLNIHLRRMLLEEQDLAQFFNANWIMNAFNEVTIGKKKVKIVQELRETRDKWMPYFIPPDRTGATQCLLYECRNLVMWLSHP